MSNLKNQSLWSFEIDEKEPKSFVLSVYEDGKSSSIELNKTLANWLAEQLKNHAQLLSE